MHLDILIFAIIAVVLIYRLNAVLGTRDGDEPPRPNPFASPDAPRQTEAFIPRPAVKTLIKTAVAEQSLEEFIDAAANADGKVSEGLAEIAAADGSFDAGSFLSGAKYAFDVIVKAYAAGDRAALRPLLSPKLYADFDRGISARDMSNEPPPAGHVKEARIFEAHLGGTMAYVTVAYTVGETADKDIWTFTRDIRASDPNWILIETRAAEK